MWVIFTRLSSSLWRTYHSQLIRYPEECFIKPFINPVLFLLTRLTFATRTVWDLWERLRVCSMRPLKNYASRFNSNKLLQYRGLNYGTIVERITVVIENACICTRIDSTVLFDDCIMYRNSKFLIVIDEDTLYCLRNYKVNTKYLYIYVYNNDRMLRDKAKISNNKRYNKPDFLFIKHVIQVQLNDVHDAQLDINRLSGNQPGHNSENGKAVGCRVGWRNPSYFMLVSREGTG